MPRLSAGLNYVNTPEQNLVVRTLDQGIPISDPFSPITNPQGSINAHDVENVIGYSQQYSFSVQRQLGLHLVVGRQLRWELGCPFAGQLQYPAAVPRKRAGRNPPAV